MFRFLIVLTVCSAGGLECWRALFDNFVVHGVGLEGRHMGALQSIREIPGFLALLVTYVLLVLKEHRLAALSIIFLGLGIFATGLLPTFYGLVLTTLVMSFGFHYYETCSQSLTLQYFDKNTAPLVFGAQQQWAAAANLIAGAGLFVIAPYFSFTSLFILFGSAITVCGIWALTRNPEKRGMVPQKTRMVIRREYWLFYFLTFMAGARRQIFIAFAVFLLVQKFNYSVREVTLLFLVNNGINFFINPLVARAIVRFGERRVLSMEYFCLILIFLSYAMVDTKWLAGLLYVLDHIFFGFAMGIKTYFQKIADPGDIAPSAAVGFTINHIAAVILPVIGGLLWMIDYRIPFVAGAGFSLVSLLMVQKIRLPREPAPDIA
jgi:predicted MFS family arabinose efflux permease